MQFALYVSIFDIQLFSKLYRIEKLFNQESA